MTRAELDRFYRAAKASVDDAGFSHEYRWIGGLSSSSYRETDLLRESAWVILCSGFREAIVRARFSYLSLCYCDWESAAAIAEKGLICVQAAKHVFRNDAKLTAIVLVAEMVVELGFDEIRQRIHEAPLEQLKALPFIGHVTAGHLAKNLGYPVAKNDRHLRRLARRLNFPDAHSLCAKVAEISGDAVSVVDTVLWRFSALGLEKT
jgi:endonuclease III